jgi:hypothetical protein
MKRLLLLLSIIISSQAYAQYRTPAQQQILTNEDSLNNGLTVGKRTVISGYGSAYVQRDFSRKLTTASLERVILFVGHQFNDRIAFFSEMELENAIVAGDGARGEIAMEQAFLKFNLNPNNYLVAGLFIPRIGLLNENHLPVNFNGVERPLVETYIIPSTWRELGVSLYGNLEGTSLNYSLAVMNGLDASGFEHGTGIREGRGLGSFAVANNIAVTGSLQYRWGDFRFQASGYVAGTTALNKRAADSLELDGGAFGMPLYMGDANVQYSRDGVSARLLAAYISFPEAARVNTTYAKNIANSMYGSYMELGYDWFWRRQKGGQFISFARYEVMDMNASIPSAPEGIYDGTLKQSHLIAGISYLPIPNVAIKADVRFQTTGEQNKALLINPPPNMLPYQQQQTFLNIGVGYSF